MATADLPSVLDLPAAARLLGIGRTKAYELVRDGDWPTPIIRLGKLIKVPTRPLLDLLEGHVGRRPDPCRTAGLCCGWCDRVIQVGRTGRIPKWCSATCRHRAWEQSRAAASGRRAVEVVEHRVEVPVVVDRKVVESPRGGPAWLPVLNDLALQLDTLRLYDRDLSAVVAAINSV